MNHKFNQIVEQISRVVLAKEEQIRLAVCSTSKMLMATILMAARRTS